MKLLLTAHFMPDSLSKILIKCMKSKAMDVPEWLTVKEMPDTFPCCFDCGDLLQSTLYCFNDLYFSDGSSHPDDDMMRHSDLIPSPAITLHHLGRPFVSAVRPAVSKPDTRTKSAPKRPKMICTKCKLTANSSKKRSSQGHPKVIPRSSSPQRSSQGQIPTFGGQSDLKRQPLKLLFSCFKSKKNIES